MDKYTLAALVGSAAFVAVLLQQLKQLMPDMPTRFLPLVSMLVADLCSIIALGILGQGSLLAYGFVIVGGFMPAGGYAAVKAIAAQPAPPAGTTGVGQPIVTTVPNGTPPGPTSTISDSQGIGRP